MASPTPTRSAGTTRAGTGLSVFVSYSRKDLGFADQLVAALDAFGFATTIDRRGIHGAENWELRLGQLILEADTVVFVLTPASATSSVCAWEVDQALTLHKRIIPVLAASLDGVTPPLALRDLNYLYFYEDPALPESGFGHGLARLTTALSIDIEWTREHTRLGAQAARWDAEARPTDLLARGSELARLQEWRSQRPPAAPELTDLQRGFLQASEDAELLRSNEERRHLEERQADLRRAEDAQAARQQALDRLSKRTKYGVAIMLILAAASITAALIAQAQRRSLQLATLRLQEGMRLRIADTSHPIETTEKWYRIATDYKLAIGIYRSEPEQRRQVASGFLVQGGSLHAKWRGRILFLTASHAIHEAATGPLSDLSRARIEFPGVDRTTLVGVQEALFVSDTQALDVAVLSLSGKLPREAIAVDLADQIESRDSLGGVAILQWTSPHGFAIGFGHGIDRPHDLEARRGRMYYTYVTGPGASGAPVFDTDSGRVVCLHVSGRPGVFGACTSVALLVSEIAAQEGT